VIKGSFLFLALMGLSWFSTNLISAETSNKIVFVAEIRGSINPASSKYLMNTITRAVDQDAQMVLVELDTPGGLVSSVRQMAQAIDSSPIPVVVFVTPAGAAATSAGALLMLSSHIAAMSPGSNIGAAHPVGPQGKDIEGTMGEKATNDVMAFAKGLAEVRKRNLKVAEEIVTKSRSLTAEEALKENLIEILASTRADLFQALDGRKVRTKNGEVTLRTQNPVIHISRMSLGDRVLHLLANPNIAGILLTLAMFLLYVELTHPGISVAGVLGVICLLIAFMALQMLPIHTGGVALLILGMVLLCAEPFAPSGGILAAGGTLAFMLGLLWVIDPAETDLRMSVFVWVPATILLGSGAAVIAVAAARMKTLSKETLERMGGGDLAGLSGYVGLVNSISEDGRSGTATIRAEIWNFASDVPVREGDRVKASSIDGAVVTVIKLDSEREA